MTRIKRPRSFVGRMEAGERRIDVIEFIELARALPRGSQGVVWGPGGVASAREDLAHHFALQTTFQGIFPETGVAPEFSAISPAVR